MTNKSTKKALLLSVLSMLICVAMLVGTTFAWFTDSVTSGRNTIQAGNLDVVLEYWDGDSYEEVTSTTKLFDDAALWEPGYTEVAYLKVSNAGSLALKYQLAVNVYSEILGKTKTGEDIKLSDYLQFKVVESDTDLADTYASREDAQNANATATKLQTYDSAVKVLEKKGDADYVALIVYMPTTVGNDANHDGVNVPSIEMGVSLFATQQTAESDSFDNQYDKDALVTVTNAAEAQAALDNAKDGAVIYLAEAINYGELLIRVNEDSELVDYYYVMSSSDTNYYGQAGWQYAKRTINNLTITGVEGAIIDSLTTSDARDDDGNAKGTRNNMFEINNLTISNITVNNTIYFNVSDVTVGTSATETTDVPHIKLNGLTIDNCKTTTGGDMASKPGRKLLGIANTGSVSNAKNITVTNCTVTDMYQGVYITDGENVRVEDNTFTNLTHNAIHINSFCSGNIVVANNIIANVAERAVRFNKVTSGTVTIKDNTITNSGDAAGELFKASGMGVDITWENNTIDGFVIELDTVGTDIIGTKPAPVTSADELKTALSQATDGDIIYLAAGTYEGLAFTNPASYKVKNLTIIGLDGAVIDGFNLNHWEPYELSFVVDGLTIKNVTFTKSLILSTRVMSNVTVEDCDFVNDACIHQNDGSEKLTNLVVKNCSFEGDKNGTTTAIMLENTENVTVTGCDFKDIDYNVLQAGKLGGTVLFDDNTVNGTGDRVFRLVTVNADMTISNNTIISDGDDAGELAKATNAVEITLNNNKWNGKTDAEVADLLVNITAK